MRTFSKMLAFLVAGIFSILMDFNEWLAKRRGYACRECGCLLNTSKQVVVKGKRYTMCEDCLELFLKGGTNGQREKREASHRPYEPP